MREVHREISKALNLRFQDCTQAELDLETSVWMEDHSRVRFDELHRPFRGIHVIRDPRDLIVSGYYYHLRCEEPWVLQARRSLRGRSYQEHLKGLSEEEGLMVELERAAFDLEGMAAWDYEAPNMLEVKFEALMGQFTREFTRIFEFYGFNEEDLEACLEIAGRHDVNTFSEERLRDDPHIHSPTPHKWRSHLSDAHRERFKERYPGLLERLGYEEGEDW